MNTNENKKKFKKPKKKTQSTTNPVASSSRHTGDSNINNAVEPICPLLAKDSEWVDILQTPSKSSASHSYEEEFTFQVDCEDGPELKPIAIMFPDLLEKDPQTLQGMLTKSMSTTEVTKHLVDLGQKANFTFMKKANRLIPPDKKWLGSLSEDSDSNSSEGSGPPSS
ncbi:uncharacterized protein isoform X2 [Choristoneura fumiferana]|uniref:uncharacterized protein isoform X2 n=1 Tax=Choristoneura fumiferana TaxID=7141 RepID=UPI003D159D37